MTNASPAAPPSANAKVDPETLVLRASPRRVTRFRRGAIIAIAAVSSTAIAGAAWFALKPAGLSLVASEDSGKEIATKAPADALANAPSSYGDVPQLGPPLPGDLGRPILAHQREIGVDPVTEGGAEQRALQEAEAERQRLAAEQKSAMQSGIMLQVSSGGRASASSPESLNDGTALASDGIPAAAAPQADPTSQQRKNAMVGRASSASDINPHEHIAAASPNTLVAGTVIAASLITGLNSGLPGFVTAQVTENAYDSVSGQTLLIPQGSRLVGSYDSVVAFGQSRALLVWQRIILPDGSSIRIDNVPATDTAGYAGLSDSIDRHTWQLLKGVGLSTLLGIGTELSFGDDESDLVRAIRESAQQSGARSGDQMVARSLDIQSTLRVRPGWPLRVVVHKDIIMRPWRASGA